MDLDLNLEPLEAQAHPSEPPGCLLAGLGEHHGRIEERIRLLESVVARFRPPLQSFSSSPAPISTSTTHTSDSDVVGNTIKPCKIDGSHLLAEALAMDCTSEQTLPSASASAPTNRKRGGSVFDCNICFSLSKDPILTCCGHLFCWPCFYSLPNSDSYSSRECPVCDGEVLETDITPIYGASSSNDSIASPLSSDQPNPPKIPPRPRARRINSVRQRPGYPPLPPHQMATQMPFHRPNPSSSQFVFQPHHFSRFLFESGNPLEESLAEHVESHINRQQLPRTQTQPLPFNVDIPLYETNSIASLHQYPLQSQTGTSSATGHSGNPVHEGYEMAMNPASTSIRRASTRRRRRRDALGR